jgi:hypothetical protein
MPMLVKSGEKLLTFNIDGGFSNPYMNLSLIPFPHSPLALRKTKADNGNTEGFALPAFRTIRAEHYWPDSSPPREQTPRIRIGAQIGDHLAMKLRLLSGQIFAR